MPKIMKISFELEYNEQEKLQGKKGPIIISRDEFKQWKVKEFGLMSDLELEYTLPLERGFYSGEIRLIEAFQSFILDRWNGGGAFRDRKND